MSILPDSLETEEGRTRLLIPEAHSSKGPGKRLGCVFFNAQMAFNRDVSVMLFRALRIKGTALDAMAATGARGVRLANESPGDYEMFINDKDPRAFRYIQANMELNSLDNCQAVNQDLRCHLASKVHDYVDIDPFGTPVPFIQPALQGLKRNGVLALTATDTAPLAGTHAKKCVRRYMARPLRNDFGHETGLRILMGYLAREAAQVDKGIRPVLCFYADHYFRCFVRCPESAAAAEESLANLGFLCYDPTTHERSWSKEPSATAYGPMWLGPLHDRATLSDMEAAEGLQERERCRKYLELWRGELEWPFFYENNELSSMLKLSPHVLEQVIERLNHIGHASRTHFSPTGFKTDLPLKDVRATYLDMA
ncbi:MAG: tRNA (guanine(26)-N(2))-dimethyltransferase [Methanomassiliicoccales archaeon]|nr:tRNA (guanine(26)-N(2))-dimethyltransferase [Methanomassiliicoccales archaeon]